MGPLWNMMKLKKDEVIMESGKKYDFGCEKISAVNWPFSLDCAIFPVMSLNFVDSANGYSLDKHSPLNEF